MDIDGDGSFLMNCQEMATAAIERLDIKMFILNNQHLGMVVQWEDRFYKVRLPVRVYGNPEPCCCCSPSWVACSMPLSVPHTPALAMSGPCCCCQPPKFVDQQAGGVLCTLTNSLPQAAPQHFQLNLLHNP